MNDQIAEIVEPTAYLPCISMGNTRAKEALQTGQQFVQASEQRLRALITTRKQTADLLRTSESRLAEAQRIARIGSWTWNAETNNVW